MEKRDSGVGADSNCAYCVSRPQRAWSRLTVVRWSIAGTASFRPDQLASLQSREGQGAVKPGRGKQCGGQRRIPRVLYPGLGGLWAGWCTQSTTPPPFKSTQLQMVMAWAARSMGTECEGEVSICVSLLPHHFSSTSNVPVQKDLEYTYALLAWVRAHASQLRSLLLALHLDFFFFFPFCSLRQWMPGLAPSCTSVSPLAAHPVRSPASQKLTTSPPTHPHTHPPCLAQSSPVLPCPALQPPPLPPKSPRPASQHTLALTLNLHTRNRPAFSSSAPRLPPPTGDHDSLLFIPTSTPCTAPFRPSRSPWRLRDDNSSLRTLFRSD